MSVLTSLLLRKIDKEVRDDECFSNLMCVAHNAGVRDEDLCERLGVAAHWVTDWREGNRLPPTVTRKKVVRMLRELDPKDPRSCWERLDDELV